MKKKEGDYFGELSLFTGKIQRNIIYKTNEICQIAYFSQEKFIEILKLYPNDYVVIFFNR